MDEEQSLDDWDLFSDVLSPYTRGWLDFVFPRPEYTSLEPKQILFTVGDKVREAVLC